MSMAALRRRRVVLAGSGGGGGEEELTPFHSESYEGGVRNDANGFVSSAGDQISISSARSYDGNGYSLAATDGPTASDAFGGQSSLNEDWDLGQYVSELAHEWYFYVPANFTHRNRAGWVENNKLWQWFRDEYGSLGAGTVQFGAEFWPMATDGSTDARSSLRAMVRLQADSFAPNYVSDAPGQTYPQLIGPEGPCVPGTWTRMRVYIKCASAWGASDGIYKIWAGDTLLYDGVGLPLHNFYEADVGQVFRRCHFFGSSNSGYVDATTFHFDKHIFYLGNPGWF